MKNIMPLDIELMMVASRWDDPATHPEWISDQGFRCREWLEREGLLDGEHITQRGAEYIKRLLAVPVDPPLKIDIPLAEPDQKDTRGFATPRTWSDVVDTGILQARIEKLSDDVNLFETRLDALAKTMVHRAQIDHMARVIEKQERQLHALAFLLEKHLKGKKS